MKPDDILDAIGTVDDGLIEKARTPVKIHKNPHIKFVSLAAGFCIVLAGIFFMYHSGRNEIDIENTFANSTESHGNIIVNSTSNSSDGTVYSEVTETDTAESTVSPETEASAEQNTTEPPTVIQPPCYWADTRERNNKVYFVENSARVWPWNCREIFDKFQQIEFNGKIFQTRASYYGNDISREMIGEKLSTAVAEGYDIYEDKTHTAKCDVYEIKGVDSERFVAVKYQGYDEFYPFIQSEYNPPETLGELIEKLNLTETFSLTSFYYGETALYGLSEADSNYIWSVFAKHADAKTEEYESAGNGRKSVSFPIFSQQLGANNLSWALYDNGYLKTNIENYGYAYYIGKDAVKEITDYVLKHKTGKIEKTKQFLVGTVTEIGEDYIKVDDSVMMKNPDDGIEFTIVADNMKVKRYIISGFLKVGKTVAIEHSGILAGNPTVVNTATNLEEVTITSNKDILIFE